MPAATQPRVTVPSNDWVDIGPAPLSVQNLGTVPVMLVAGGSKPVPAEAGQVIATSDPWTLSDATTNIWVRAAKNSAVVALTRF